MHSRRRIGPIAIAGCAALLASCEQDPLGLRERTITREYYLARGNNPNEYALAARVDDGGELIAQVGWHEPLILARLERTGEWEVIDTTTDLRRWVSDAARVADPKLRAIRTVRAGDAWRQLRWCGKPKW